MFRMKDMMEVLLQCDPNFCIIALISDRSTPRLNGVADPKQIGPDGDTVEGRMQKHCRGAAEDIENCGNACDTYLQ
jgi:hypothetical protein